MQPSFFILKGAPHLLAGTKKLSSVLLAFLGVYLTVRYLGPLFLPFLLGGALALAAEPMTSFFQKRTKLPRVVSTALSVSMAFSLLVLLVMLAAAFFLRELRSLAGVLPDLEDTARSGMTLMENWLLTLTARTPESVRPLLDRNVTEFFSGGTRLLDGIMGWVLGLAGGVLAHVPDGALGLGTAIISGFMISAKLPKIRLWLKTRIPRERLQPLFQAARRVRQAVGGWLFAQAKLAGVTWGLLTLGFWILGISYPPLWALAIALVDAFPVLGTGTVLVPWALVCFLQGEGVRTIGLLSTYLTVTLVRSALEPKLLGKHLGLDPLATLIAMYAGYKIWGIGGMILSPLIAVTATQIIPDRREQA